jgi:L-asparaginase / beta-aspartyl-peptidase
MSEIGLLNGKGGMIFVAPDGRCGWHFNTPGMYRARASSNGQSEIAIYEDE